MVDATGLLSPQVLVERALDGVFVISESELLDVIAIFSLTPDMGGVLVDWVERSVFVNALSLSLSFKREVLK